MIGLYIRVSTLGQKDNYSVATQIQKGIEFATQRGDTFQIYQEAESGSSTDNRFKFEELMKDIQDGKIQKVWVIESSRFNRNMEDSLRLQRIFSKFNIEYYVNGILTALSSAENKLSYHVQSAVNEYERTKLIERSVRGKSEWQNTGYMSLPNIYGYDYKYKEDGSKEWFINEKEAEVIKLIYKLYTEDRLPYNQIMRKLNDLGYRTKKGFDWAKPQVMKVLTQSLYYGMSWTTDGQPIPSKIYPPIIEKELFDKAQYIIKTTTNIRNKFKSRRASNELTGLIQCEICGAPYHTSLTQKKQKDGTVKEWTRYYHSISSTKYKTCADKGGIDKPETDLLITNVVRDEFFENEDKFIEWWKRYQNKTGLKIDELKQAILGYEESKCVIEKKRDTIVEAIASGTLSKLEAKNVLMKYSSEISTIEAKISSLKLELSEQVASIDDEVYKAITDLTIDFENLSIQQKRSLYKMIFKCIKLNGKKVTIVMYDGSIKRRMIRRLGTIGKRRK